VAVCFLTTAIGRPTAAASFLVLAPQTLSDKASRTPSDSKVSSQLLTEIRNHDRSTASRAPLERTVVKVDARERALVDVRAVVAEGLQKKMRALGATIVSTSPEYRSIVAWLPLAKIRQLAADPEVIAIQPAPEGTTVK